MNKDLKRLTRRFCNVKKRRKQKEANEEEIRERDWGAKASSNHRRAGPTCKFCRAGKVHQVHPTPSRVQGKNYSWDGGGVTLESSTGAFLQMGPS